MDAVEYLYDFFRLPGSTCLVWELDGVYLSILRLEPYSDGYLLTGLETAPNARRKGHGLQLMEAAQQYLKGIGANKVYAHIKKNNLASLKLHEKCGFCVISDFGVLLDGTVSQQYVTVCSNI